MSGTASSLRVRAFSLIGRVLPARVSMPLRSRIGFSREPELSVLSSFVRAGDTVIDIGAHKGSYTYRLAGLVGSSGHVIAYEPQPSMIDYLRPALASAKLRHVDLRTVALSDQPGQATLSVPVEDGVRIIGQATLRDVGAGADEFTVAVTTLDAEAMPGPVTFIKIDVEGHELALLRGAVGLLERDRPTLLIEVENRHAGDRVPQLAALLLDTLGYQAAELDPDGRLVPTERALWDAGDRLNTRPGDRYVNNFVFTPATPTSAT